MTSPRETARQIAERYAHIHVCFTGGSLDVYWLVEAITAALVAEGERVGDEADVEWTTTSEQLHHDLEMARAEVASLTAELAQARQEKDRFWAYVSNAYDIEPRSYFEGNPADASVFGSPLAQAAHHIWKRDPKVSELEQQLAEAQQAEQAYGIAFGRTHGETPEQHVAVIKGIIERAERLAAEAQQALTEARKVGKAQGILPDNEEGRPADLTVRTVLDPHEPSQQTAMSIRLSAAILALTDRNTYGPDDPISVAEVTALIRILTDAHANVQSAARTALLEAAEGIERLWPRLTGIVRWLRARAQSREQTEAPRP